MLTRGFWKTNLSPPLPCKNRNTCSRLRRRLVGHRNRKNSSDSKKQKRQSRTKNFNEYVCSGGEAGLFSSRAQQWMCWYRNRKAGLEYRADEGTDDRQNYLCFFSFSVKLEIRSSASISEKRRWKIWRFESSAKKLFSDSTKDAVVYCHPFYYRKCNCCCVLWSDRGFRSESPFTP